MLAVFFPTDIGVNGSANFDYFVLFLTSRTAVAVIETSVTPGLHLSHNFAVNDKLHTHASGIELRSSRVLSQCLTIHL